MISKMKPTILALVISQIGSMARIFLKKPVNTTLLIGYGS
jgi:hypothetical protein